MNQIPKVSPLTKTTEYPNLKSYLFYLVLLILLYFIPHNLLLVEHRQIDTKILQMEKKYEELTITHHKLSGEKDERISKIFQEERKDLKPYSIKNIPLIEFVELAESE